MWPAVKWLSPVDEMVVFEFINRSKMTIVRLPQHNQTHADICMHNANASSGKLGCVCHLLMCADTRDMKVLAK